MSGLAGLTDGVRSARSDAFPYEGLALLSEAGFMTDVAEATDAVHAGTPAMFARLVAIGRGDLALGRLYEGHVNAAGLIARLGTKAQRGRTAEGLLGVWGADDGSAPGRLERVGGRYVLRGRKTYASGAGALGHALVVVKDEEERSVVVLLDAKDLRDRFDPSWWRPLGMTTTDSFAISIEGLSVTGDDLIGAPGDYLHQPYFGGGAVRFAAVQTGGVLAVWDAMRTHLIQTGRYDDPIQAARLGEALAEAEACYATVRDAYARLNEAISWEGQGQPGDETIADAARTVPMQTGERVMTIATRAVGCAGLMAGHPLDRAIRDLAVYLRQPAPDAALRRAGIAAADGTYRPIFDDGTGC